MNRHFRSQVRLSCDGKLTRNRANSNFHPQSAIVILAPICFFFFLLLFGPSRPLLCAVGILKVDSCLLNLSYNKQTFLNWTELKVFIEFCKKCKKVYTSLPHTHDMLVFSADRNVKVFLLGATIHGLAGLRALKTANWRLWRTRNWEMTPFFESPFTVHLLRPTMASAVNTTYSLKDMTALSQLILQPFCLFKTMVVLGSGIQFQLKWADFAMPRLEVNCYLEIFKFQFISKLLAQVVMHSLVHEV